MPQEEGGFLTKLTYKGRDRVDQKKDSTASDIPSDCNWDKAKLNAWGLFKFWIEKSH